MEITQGHKIRIKNGGTTRTKMVTTLGLEPKKTQIP